MIAEAPGPLDFQMLLQLFGEKMSGTDPEETIMAGWHLFDPTASGEMNVDAVKSLLCSRGVKADRLTEAEVAQMFDQVKPAGGKFNYGKFTRIMKRGSTSRFSRRLVTGTFHTRKVLISSHDDNQSDHQLKKKMMPALLTKISGELTRNNINNNNNNNICLPPNVETWITEPSNCHLAVLLYINFNSRENRVNNM